MAVKAPNIYHYHQFSDFFSAYLQLKKSENRGFSYRVLCRHLGIKSPALIHWIATGKRQPSHTMLRKLREVVGLSAEEYQYAQSLVGLKKSHNLNEKKMHAAVLEDVAAQNILTLDQAAVELMSKWFIVAILEMTELKGFQNDVAWIRKRLGNRVSELEVRHAQTVLRVLGLVVKDKKGGLRRVAKNVSSNDHTTILGARKFHVEVMSLAQAAIHKQPPAERFYSGSTFNINTSDLPKAQDFLERMRREFITIFQAKEGEETYQFSLQFFRLTDKAETYEH